MVYILQETTVHYFVKNDNTMAYMTEILPDLLCNLNRIGFSPIRHIITFMKVSSLTETASWRVKPHCKAYPLR